MIKTLEMCNIQLTLSKQIIVMGENENCYEAQDVIKHLNV